eukprot:1340988-Rhodomonas_salina.3
MAMWDAAGLLQSRGRSSSHQRTCVCAGAAVWHDHDDGGGGARVHRPVELGSRRVMSVLLHPLQLPPHHAFHGRARLVCRGLEQPPTRLEAATLLMQAVAKPVTIHPLHGQREPVQLDFAYFLSLVPTPAEELTDAGERLLQRLLPRVDLFRFLGLQSAALRVPGVRDEQRPHVKNARLVDANREQHEGKFHRFCTQHTVQALVRRGEAPLHPPRRVVCDAATVFVDE